MLVHIHDHQRTAERRMMLVIPRPVVVKHAGMEVIPESYPSGSTSERVPGLFELRFPHIVTTPGQSDGEEDIAARLAIASQVLEIEIVHDDGPGANQLLAFEVAIHIWGQIFFAQ